MKIRGSGGIYIYVYINFGRSQGKRVHVYQGVSQLTNLREDNVRGLHQSETSYLF